LGELNLLNDTSTLHRNRRVIGQGGCLGSLRAGGEKLDVFYCLQERLTRFPKEEDSLEEELTR